jgi:hypothetical protein
MGVYNNKVQTTGVDGIIANKITYIAMTIKNNTLLLYKDGIFVNKLIAAGNFNLNSPYSNCLAIGANSNSATTVTGEYFRGKIHSVRLYSSALVDTEIYNNFKTDITMFNLSETESVGNVSKIRIGQEKMYDLKDIYSRTNKLSKTEDDTAFGVINFTKGIQIDKANILYDEVNDIVTFM